MFTAGKSVYTRAFADPLGLVFDAKTFPELPNALESGDVSSLLQEAILRLTREQNYGILYIPEGDYPICHTVMVPKAVRLIGYGSKRPVFVLPQKAEGFDGPVDSNPPGFGQDLPGANYMIWFIANQGEFAINPSKNESHAGRQNVTIMDANAGTFYSALSNIDFRVEGNHPGAVCIRAHFAQHGFVSHCHFDLGSAYAGIYDVGNEMEDLSFDGGCYGMICRMTSPGWPFVLMDSKFKGQSKAALLTMLNGFTGFRLDISDTPKAFDLWASTMWEKLYLEDCRFNNISESLITSSQTGNALQQTNLKNLLCKKVANFIDRVDVGEKLCLEENFFLESYTAGYVYKDDMDEPEFMETYCLGAMPSMEEEEELLASDIPELPPMETWVSVRDYGALGDGQSDDTKALQDALAKEKVLYLPQGIYRVTDSLELTQGQALIAMHPATTQLVILDDSPNFAGFGAPKPVLSATAGSVLVNGLGIDTMGKNPRAVGIYWKAGAQSYMNDVKFMGGHGLMYRDGRNPFETMYNASRTADYIPERIWDYQYASLWIAENGGGIFKDIWSASPYAEAGIAVTDTDTECRMYAISLEHHVRHEIKINHVKNLKIFALQTEEERAEGMQCLPMEIVSSQDIEVVNYYLFRVVSVDESFDMGVRLSNCRDITFKNFHNKAQMQYTFTLALRDQTTGFSAKSSDYALLSVAGNVVCEKPQDICKVKDRDYQVLGTGYRFAQGLAVRSNGDIYWCDKKTRTIYCHDMAKKVTYPVLDIHYTPAALAFDSQDNLLIAVDYSELKDHAGTNPFADHDRSNYHPFFSWFYKRSERMYAVNPDHPYVSMQVLRKVSSKDIDLSNRPVIRCSELDYPGMFDFICSQPLEEYYLAPDGITLVEGSKDIARCLRLECYQPGEPGIITDDSLRKSYRFDVTEGGNLTNPVLVAERGQYGAFADAEGIVWTIEDRLYGYKDGELVESIDIPWDCYSLKSVDGGIVLMGRSSVYML